jgi:hypothetical protein
MKTIIENPSKKRIEQLVADGIPFTYKNNILVVEESPTRQYKTILNINIQEKDNPPNPQP